jgi:hypothetical protein
MDYTTIKPKKKPTAPKHSTLKTPAKYTGTTTSPIPFLIQTENMRRTITILWWLR